ncbi:MAG: TetR/AcrR family transcriptional regulator C-terminal domain-containing protein [Chloroflexota bacterium]|nr:TetR/AcrR family transcriptional regulator C-terminal domain-containing protein [Chloroflexota bacterium]
MASQVDRSAPARVPLSRDRVLQAAISLADAGGIESLSMRKLAQELGVEAMSVYYYVANKDAILDGIVDIVVAEFDMAAGGADWKSAIRHSAISAHDVLMRHPWACGLMMSAKRVSSARLQYMESLLKRLREAGFSASMTHHAYHALDSHIIGSTLWEAGYSANRDLTDKAKAFVRKSVDAFPYVVEHAEQHLTKSKRSDIREFEFGLDLILDGLEKIRDRRS